MSKHTKGPWYLAANFHQTGRIVTEYGENEIADLQQHQRHNAQLIAAAPDMLTELKRIQTELSEHGNADAELVSRLERIIAKAEGNNE